ncbi:hypothetical protein HDU91_000609 [Kappamyces sp. JEL0680]|nr:hypothetical protein HDU91_000609 [Kappamyces sp. JEL0680]
MQIYGTLCCFVLGLAAAQVTETTVIDGTTFAIISFPTTFSSITTVKSVTSTTLTTTSVVTTTLTSASTRTSTTVPVESSPAPVIVPTVTASLSESTVAAAAATSAATAAASASASSTESTSSSSLYTIGVFATVATVVVITIAGFIYIRRRAHLNSQQSLESFKESRRPSNDQHLREALTTRRPSQGTVSLPVPPAMSAMPYLGPFERRPSLPEDNFNYAFAGGSTTGSYDMAYGSHAPVYSHEPVPVQGSVQAFQFNDPSFASLERVPKESLPSLENFPTTEYNE